MTPIGNTVEPTARAERWRAVDPDDWFADPSSPGSSSGWTTPVDAPSAEASPAARVEEASDGFTVTLRTLLGAAAVLVALIVLAGLALAGVFSGGGEQRSTSPTTAQRPTTVPRSTTPTTPAHSQRQALAAPTTTLKPGDEGSQVKRLQRALTRLGYSAGAADGVYGSATRSALMRFQTASSLTADGVLGPKTLRALKAAIQKE